MLETNCALKGRDNCSPIVVPLQGTVFFGRGIPGALPRAIVLLPYRQMRPWAAVVMVGSGFGPQLMVEG